MERILIVDDDSDIQRLVSYNLSQAGFQVSAAVTGVAALHAVEERLPDLIILDIMLPDLGGLEVCRLVREREKSRRIPIIMLTARTEEIDRVVGFEVGADDYVMKPFSPRELVLRVKSILRRVGNDSGGEALRIGKIELFPQRRQVRPPGATHASSRKCADSRDADEQGLGIPSPGGVPDPGHPCPPATRKIG